MRENFFRKVLIFVVIGLFIGAGFLPNITGNIVKETKKSYDKTFNETSYCFKGVQNDAELPIWNVGDSWIYNIDFKGNHGSDINFDISISNLKFEVVNVLGDKYLLNYNVNSGDINGNIFVDLDILSVSGELKVTSLEGWVKVNKTDLNILNGIIDINGYIDQIVDVHFISHIWMAYYNNELDETNFFTIKFPLNVGDEWSNPFTYLGFYLEESNIAENKSIVLGLNETNFKCTEWTVVKVNDVDYDVLEISRDSSQNRYWFSLGAGNIVKVDYDNLDLGLDRELTRFDMELVSTNYNAPTNPPNIPSRPSGPISMDVSETGSYSTGTTDPDGDIIRYIFDWGDGTKTNTEFHDSGDSVTEFKKWARKGNYIVKVKARDKYGKESDWSDTLTVNVLNNAPDKPSEPLGPSNGTVGCTYTYSTYSTDPDGHQVKYGWDWDDDNVVDTWSELAQSGDTISSSNTWEEKGDYQVKVKALDEYGEESEWSDALTVSLFNMAPNKPSIPSGPPNGKIGRSYTYSTSSTDPDGHQVKYGWDWDGDNVVDTWSKLAQSGDTISSSHTWEEKGDYQIKVQAKDEYDEISEWSDPLSISMPKNKSISTPFLRFLEKYPHLFPLLRQIMRL